MHEVSLCENIRETLEAEAVSQGFDRVTRIWLEVGALSCVEPEALRFGFDAVMQGSVAEGASLDIVAPPATGTCFACGATVTIPHRNAPCPECRESAVQLTGGDALKIKKVEVV